MTKQEYLDFFVAFTERMRDLTRKKNDDYSAGLDPFANFTRVEALGICSTEQGFLTRMTDKMSRICSFVQRGELSVKEESVTDTLMDLAVYSILMAAFLHDKKTKAATTRRPAHVAEAIVGYSVDTTAIAEARCP
jgi:hypothetical protein